MNDMINDNNRDMFYSGYYGMAPMPNMPNQMLNPNMMNQNLMTQPQSQYGNYNYDNNYYNNLNNRITRLENQIKLINQRLTRLEAPYTTSTNNTTNIYNNEPDSNMYMM